MSFDIENAFLFLSATCTRCEGTGRVELTQPGTLPTPAVCPNCTGGIVSVPVRVTEFAKALLPILFPPAVMPTPDSAPVPLTTVVLPVVEGEAKPSVPEDIASETEVNI